MNALQRPIEGRVHIRSGTPAASNGDHRLEPRFACLHAAPSVAVPVPMMTGFRHRRACARRNRRQRTMPCRAITARPPLPPDRRPRRAAPHEEGQNGDVTIADEPVPQRNDLRAGRRNRRRQRRRRRRFRERPRRCEPHFCRPSRQAPLVIVVGLGERGDQCSSFLPRQLTTVRSPSRAVAGSRTHMTYLPGTSASGWTAQLGKGSGLALPASQRFSACRTPASSASTLPAAFSRTMPIHRLLCRSSARATSRSGGGSTIAVCLTPLQVPGVISPRMSQ